MRKSAVPKILLLLPVLLICAAPQGALAAAGNCAEFTKTSNTYIAAESSTELKTISALTLEAWIRPTGTSGEWSLILGKQYNGSDTNPWYSYRLCKSNSGSFPDTVNFNIAPITSGGEVGVTSSTVVQNDTWTHVAGVYDGATLKMYINGALENTVAATGALRESDLPLYMGKAPWTNYNNFNGRMDELRIWNVARTQAQIQYAMSRSLQGDEAGLVGYWLFNDAAGSATAADASPYNHVGTLYNGAAIVANSDAPVSSTCAYITNSGSNTVSVIDTVTNSVVWSISVGSLPWGAAINRAGTRVYVANINSNSVSVIDTGDRSVIGTVSVGSGPRGVAVSPSGSRVYVANHASNTVTVINADNNTVAATIAVGGKAHGVAVNPSGTRVYVTNGDDDTVSVIDTSDNTVVDTIAVGDFPLGVVVDPSGSRVYVANVSGNSVSVINAGTNTVEHTVSVGAGAYGVAITPSGKRVYVANYYGNSVSVIDTSDHTVAAPIAVGTEPEGVAIDPSGSRGYVANYGANTVSVIDIATDTVIATVAVGSQPVGYGILVGPDITAPALTGLGVTYTSGSEATLSATSDENATGYWIVVARDAEAPTSAQVKAGLDYGSVTVVAHGFGAMVASTATDFAVSGLTSATDYDLYLVAEDFSANLSPAPEKQQLATADIVPDPFTFTDQTGMPLNTTIVSNPITVTGITGPAPVSITGGDYRINSGAWTHDDSMVDSENTVEVKVTSSAANSDTTSATLTIGTVSDTFSVTTAAADDPNADGLVAWWKAEDNALDSVNGNHGTPQGGLTYAAGQSGQAYSFNGTDAYVDIAITPSLDFGTDDFTISFLMNLNALTQQTLVHKSVGDVLAGTNKTYFVEYDSDTSALRFRTSDSSVVNDLMAPFSCTIGQWYHVTAVRSGATNTLYVNGAAIDSQTAVGLADTGSGGYFRIGQIAPNGIAGLERYVNGKLDEIKLYSRALSEGEVNSLAGTRPDAFYFIDQTGVALDTPVESNAVTVTGTTRPASISIAGSDGQYAIFSDNGSIVADWTNMAGTVALNRKVKVRLTSAGTWLTTDNTTLTIGGVSDTFSVTTGAEPTTTTTEPTTTTVEPTTSAPPPTTTSVSDNTTTTTAPPVETTTAPVTTIIESSTTSVQPSTTTTAGDNATTTTTASDNTTTTTAPPVVTTTAPATTTVAPPTTTVQPSTTTTAGDNATTTTTAEATTTTAAPVTSSTTSMAPTTTTAEPSTTTTTAKCPFAKSSADPDQTRSLRRLRDDRIDTAIGVMLVRLYYQNAAAIGSILQDDAELNERFTRLVRWNMPVVRGLLTLGAAVVPGDDIAEVCEFLHDLQDRADAKLRMDIDFILRGIETGWLLSWAGVTLEEK